MKYKNLLNDYSYLVIYHITLYFQIIKLIYTIKLRI